MSSHNVSYFINGFEACNDYNYACFIADSLSQVLHNFSVNIATKSSSDWKDWLEQTCELHNWNHNESPLIWRANDTAGKPIYIGGIGEFKLWLKNYYRIDATLPNVDQEAFNLDYALAQNIELRDGIGDHQSEILNITISGAGAPICFDLIAHLAKMKDPHYNRLVIKLYDESGCCCETLNNVENISDTECHRLSTDIVENLSDSLENCDILIVLKYLPRETEETSDKWLSRNYEAIKDMAEEIEKSDAPPHMKVIFCSLGPDCFCANALIKEAKKLNKNNVVAVSAHHGLKMANRFVDMLGISDEEIGCPPSWGFLGISQYVDIHHTIQKCSVYVPNKRALTFDRHSTLPLGTKFDELRWLQYMTLKDKFHETLHDCNEGLQIDQGGDSLRCKALCNLLELWCRKDRSDIEDDIISLGIVSDGTFNIPKGVFFSQPVHLKILDDDSLTWVPCSGFPTPSDSETFTNMFTLAKNILESMKLLVE